MSDLRKRVPAHALMEMLVSLRGTADIRELPFGMVWLSKEALSWLRGVRGELFTAKRLRALGDGWTSLHSVPVGERGSDIDHIVIGRGGVFPINAKRLIDKNVWVAGGEFQASGQKRDYIRNSEFERRRVERVLERLGLVAPVIPVIAISGAKQITVKSPAAWDGRPVEVCSVDQVVGRIRKRPAKLSEQEVDRIVGILSESGHWSAAAESDADVAQLRTQYEAINRGVDRWNVMARLLTLLVIAAGVAVLWAYLRAIG